MTGGSSVGNAVFYSIERKIVMKQKFSLIVLALVLGGVLLAPISAAVAGDAGSAPAADTKGKKKKDPDCE
jgi:hypothetical protein